MRFSGSGRSYTAGVGNASETTFGVANDFFLYDDTAGAMRMVVDSTGNVGISTTNPQALLHVNGAISASNMTLSGDATLNGTSSLNYLNVSNNAVVTGSITVTQAVQGIQGQIVGLTRIMYNL